LFGAMKKITNVTNMITRKSTIAQRVRLTRYRNMIYLGLVAVGNLISVDR